MNIRQRYELKYLLNESELDILKISAEFNINERTVRYDIEIVKNYIIDILKKECVFLKKNIAYFMGTKDDIETLQNALNNDDYYSMKLSTEERVINIIFDLCWSNEEITIDSLSSKYSVARTTINSDITTIKKWCVENNIEFITRLGKGIQIKKDLNNQRANLSKVIRLYEQQKKVSSYLSDDIVRKWFPNIDIELIAKIVQSSEERYKYWLSDNSFEALVIHIAMAIKRFKLDGYKENKVTIDDNILNSVQYVMATKIVSDINKSFNVSLDDYEVYYVSVHIGSKPSSEIENNNASFTWLEINTFDLINYVSDLISFNLKEDEKLFNGLLQHMKASLIRYENNMDIHNPLKEELISSYHELYKILEKAIKELNCRIKPTEDEISYILLHFAAAISRKETNVIKLPKLCLVCATGIGTAELVLSHINKVFTYESVNVMSEHKFYSMQDKLDVDLVISTVSLNTKLKNIQVSAILKEEDINLIRTTLFDLGFVKTDSKNNNMNKVAKQLSELVNKFSGMDQEERLMSEIINISNNLNIQRSNKTSGRKIKMLSDVLLKSYIKLQESCVDWKDAIRKSGQLLVESECVTTNYIEAIIKSVIETGPYIVITKGVALPHASNTEGVNKTALSLLTLKEPINFGNKSNDPVEFVFTLATVDSISHLKALSDLSEFLGRKEFLDLLRNSNSPSEIMKYIKENETK